MKDFQSRREFLVSAGKVVGAAALLSTLPAGQVAVAETAAAAVHPFPMAELDLDAIEKIAYEGYFENGCCYGVAKGLLAELSAKVGYPWNLIPAEMFANGKEGYTCGTLCGAMGGAVGIIGLACAPADARKLTSELCAWYTSTALPMYQPEAECPVQTVSPTVNCIDSITTFMTAANVERADPIRKRRCGGVTADVARKTAELLNVHYGYAEAPVEVASEPELAANEYIGEGQGFGGPIKVKVTMDGDKIVKIDVLSHNETPGISNPAFDTIPNAVIAAQSTQVDTVSNATRSSNGLIEAINDALSKVKK